MAAAARWWTAGVVLLAASAVGWLAVAGAGARTEAPSVAVTTVRGPITPIVADHLADTIALAARDGHQALVVELDTPGGLVTSMRDIVQGFLAAPLPVVVYVAPPGADAGSAGTFVTLAAHIAAMAPATTIGAATPIDLEGGEVGDKVVNNAAAYAEAIAELRGRNVEFAVAAVRDGRSITAEEAVRIGAVDLLARDLGELLERIDGRRVELADGRTVTLRTADAATVALEMSGVRRILQRLADPNLALVFLSVGTLAILYELANPGIGAGGIVGTILLILAFTSLAVLPVNYAGVALIVLAVLLFVAELFVPGVGVLAAGGTIALVLGGLLLFPEPTGLGIDLAVLLPTAAVVLVLVVLLARAAARLRRTPSVGGADLYVGREVTVERVDDAHRGRARIDGTWWRLRSEVPLSAGDRVRVVSRDGLELVVRPVTSKEEVP